MQTLTILFFGFLSGSAQAQVGGPGGISYSNAVAAPSNPAEACVSDICGVPAASNTYLSQYLDRLGEYMRLAKDPKQVDFPPAIAKLFADLAAEGQKQNDVALALLRRSTSLGAAEPAGVAKAMYNVGYAAPFLKKLKYKASTVDGKTTSVVDEAASSAQLSGLSPEDRSWVIQVGKFFLEAYSSSPVADSSVQSAAPALLLKALHPGLSVVDAMRSELGQAQAAAAALKGLSPLEAEIFFNNSSPDRVAFIARHVADGTVDENETREIIQWNRDCRTNTLLFKSPASPLLSRPAPPAEGILAKAGGVEAVASSFSADRAEERRRDDDKVQSCKMLYFLNKGLLPSAQQVATLDRDVLRSRRLVEDMIRSKFPAEMQPKLIKSVEDSDFLLPPTASGFERSFADSLRQKLESERANGPGLDLVDPGEMRSILSVFSLMRADKDPNEPKSQSNGFCDAFKYAPMSDGNYTTFGSIALSFTTATGDEASRLKTIMHELGHSVSKAISDDPKSAARFAGVRRCLADQHTEEPPPQTKKAFEDALAADPKANGPYVEEDFADTVAGNSGRDVKGRNPWCQFLGLSYDRQQYQDSALKADDGDTHSASLFRLLDFEEMKTGAMPDSCRSYLASVRYRENFSSCFDLVAPGAPGQAEPSRTNQ